MCQSTAYLAQDGGEELLLEDVISIKPEGDKIQLVSLFGERKIIDFAKITFIDLIHHKIVLEKRT